MTNNTIQTLHRSAQVALNNRDYVEAHRLCVKIIELQADHADAYFLLGIINFEVGQVKKATKLIEKAISFKGLAEYFAHLAKCYSLMGDMSSVVKIIEHVPVSRISKPLTLDTIGVSLSHVGDHARALPYFEKALLAEKSNPGFYYNFGVSSKFAGLFQQANEAFESAIRLQPKYYQAHFALSDLGGVTKESNHISRLEGLLDDKAHPDNLLHLGHALAKEYEAIGDFDKSFDILNRVKSRKVSTIQYGFSDDKALFDFVRDTKFIPSKDSACQSSQPIIIVGMPRSGTTLVERILSNHTQVHSCGELQDFGVAVKELANTGSSKVLDMETLQAAQHLNFKTLGERYIERTQAVSGGSEHFIDKLPFNFFYIDLIRKALPKAKIICMLRDPMDTCIGNYRQLFSINSPYYHYAYSLKTIGLFYAEFYKLVYHKAAENSANLMLCDYQELVEDPRNKVSELLSFCDLQWQEQCLHAETNTAPVSTASKVQVREPINTKSVGRWKKFRPHTDALEALLTEKGVLDS
ncbi:tetratricopeptide repeat-containing sulfotransferase family protein [Paraglaciecola sp. 2405UD69-4]|uniref:tetratricopeptide repeat-containing sulfotransferase family protein n=1 Tax=Paraglaciecola sp. 2405UD69-4 TaxID=3391836 RepID=UPI0039C91FD7